MQDQTTKQKNILIVTAHPSPTGFTHKMAIAYKQGAEKKGYKVEILDLYKTELQQGYFCFEYTEQNICDKEVATRKIMQDKIMWANEVIFVSPMWWGTVPAIMKNWIDMNFTSHFSHKYVDGKLVKMLHEKSARVYMTSDAPAHLYWLVLNPFARIFSFNLFWFVGMKNNGIKLFGNFRLRTEEEKERFLEKVRDTA
jgi:putative NADPH-quinone reductase